jgi:hypothetical protein
MLVGPLGRWNQPVRPAACRLSAAAGRALVRLAALPLPRRRTCHTWHRCRSLAYSLGQIGTARVAASSTKRASTCTRDSLIPRAGHSHTNPSGPGGGSPHTQ